MNRFSAVIWYFIPVSLNFPQSDDSSLCTSPQISRASQLSRSYHNTITPTEAHRIPRGSALSLANGHPLPTSTPASPDSSVAPAVHSLWSSPLALYKERSQIRVRCPKTSFPSGVGHACHAVFPSHHVDQWLNMRGNGVLGRDSFSFLSYDLKSRLGLNKTLLPLALRNSFSLLAQASFTKEACHWRSCPSPWSSHLGNSV